MTHFVTDTAIIDIKETVLCAVWPSIGATRIGRLVGRAAATNIGWKVFNLGNILALLLAPVALAAYFWLRAPGVWRRYVLTSRRVIITRGPHITPHRWIRFDQFDTIDVVFLPGQRWLRCGEVIFRRGQQELFRLSAVPCPEVFRRCCLQARQVVLATCQSTGRQQVLAEQAG